MLLDTNNVSWKDDTHLLLGTDNVSWDNVIYLLCPIDIPVWGESSFCVLSVASLSVD